MRRAQLGAAMLSKKGARHENMREVAKPTDPPKMESAAHSAVSRQYKTNCVSTQNYGNTVAETIETVASNWVTTVQKIVPRTPETTGVTYTTTGVGAATVHLFAAAYTQLGESPFLPRDIVTLSLLSGCVRKLSLWFNVNVYPFALSCVPLKRRRLAFLCIRRYELDLHLSHKTSDKHFTHGSKILPTCSHQRYTCCLQ